MGWETRGWGAGLTRWRRLVGGAMTIVAFTESGHMRRMRVSKKLLLFALLLLIGLLIGSTMSVLSLFRGQVDLARMVYLERENRSLTSLLERQAEQLSRLKLEVVRLKEFEQSLRVVSGMDAPPEPAAGTSQTRGSKREPPRKR